MTMQTYRYFTCPNAHKGVEKTSENDQPYSKGWESTTISGMTERGKDPLGYAKYLCEVCEQAMVLDNKS